MDIECHRCGGKNPAEICSKISVWEGTIEAVRVDRFLCPGCHHDWEMEQEDYGAWENEGEGWKDHYNADEENGDEWKEIK